MSRRTVLYSLLPVLLLVAGAIVLFELGVGGQTKAEKVQTSSVTEPTSAQAPQAIDKKVAEKQKKEEKQTAKQDGWRENAAEREQPVPEQAAGTEQPAPEQPAAPTSTALSLTVPKAGVYNVPVANTLSESALAQGAGKAPSTGFPWQQGSNTYIAGHVYGYQGTPSWQLFADLPSMAAGDTIKLTDANGATYTYRVTNIMTVNPTDVWVMNPTGNGTTVSLQTCVGPNWSKRLIVRGSLVSTA